MKIKVKPSFSVTVAILVCIFIICQPISAHTEDLNHEMYYYSVSTGATISEVNYVAHAGDTWSHVWYNSGGSPLGSESSSTNSFTKKNAYRDLIYNIRGNAYSTQFFQGTDPHPNSVNFTYTNSSHISPSLVRITSSTVGDSISGYSISDNVYGIICSGALSGNNPTPPVCSRTYDVVGTYTITATITAYGSPNVSVSHDAIVLPVAPIANFTATPITGTSPLNVVFTDTSTNTPTSWEWTFGDGQFYSNVSQITHTYQNPGIYSPSLTVINGAGTSNKTIPNYIIVTTQNGLHLIVNSLDAETGYEITSSTIGIQNKTSNIWWNLSTPTGGAFFQSTDVAGIYSLSQNQNVTVGASAYGYLPSFEEIKILQDNQEVNLHLTKTSQTPTNGNWNLLVKLVRNLDGQPVCSATVKVITGVNGPGVYEGSPVCSTGVVSFFNLSASASASIEVIAQGYKSAGAFTPVVPNSTQQITIQMVRIYDTPVATPIPVTTTSAGFTGQPTPQITDASGNPITSSEGKATWSLDQLFNILPQIVMIVCSLIFAWLFWRGVDIITNGMATLIMRRVIEGFLKGMFK